MPATITPFLWFDGNLQEAVSFYASVFKQSRIISTNPMSAHFEIEGQRFMGLNGGPHFKFNEAVSFFISVQTQAEIDYYWEALTGDGGAEGQCGWLKDRFGLSWQVIPEKLGQLLSDPDRARAERVVGAMMRMKKIIIADLEQAAAS